MTSHDRCESDPASDHAGQALHADDLRLAREALAGSPSARHRFAEEMRCVPKFLCVMNTRMGRQFKDDEIEEIVQEALMEIWRRLDSYAGLASLKTWAYRFCQKVLSSRLRSQRRRPRVFALDENGDRGTEPSATIDYAHVHAALDRMDEKSARIVRHKHFDQWTFQQIARSLSMPESSAKLQYQRAIARLRELLEPLRKESGL